MKNKPAPQAENTIRLELGAPNKNGDMRATLTALLGKTVDKVPSKGIARLKDRYHGEVTDSQKGGMTILVLSVTCSSEEFALRELDAFRRDIYETLRREVVAENIQARAA